MKKKIGKYYVVFFLLLNSIGISLAQKPPLFDSVYLAISELTGAELKLLSNEYNEPLADQPEFGHSALFNWDRHLVVYTFLAANTEAARGIMYGFAVPSKLINNEIQDKDLDDAFYQSYVDLSGNTTAMYLGRRGNAVFYITVSSLSNYVELSRECGDLIAKIFARNLE